MSETPSLPDEKERQLAAYQQARQTRRASRQLAIRSTIIRWVRLILPLIAVGVIGILFAWPQLQKVSRSLPQEKNTQAPQIISRNELINPRFESRDSENRPFTVTAKRAQQSANNSDTIILERPMADMTLGEKNWVAAEADNGEFHQKEETLLLTGDVRLFHDAGYELKTTKLLVNMGAQTATTDQSVSIRGPAGTIDATGMQADGTQKNVIFTGPAKLVLFQTKSKK